MCDCAVTASHLATEADLAAPPKPGPRQTSAALQAQASRALSAALHRAEADDDAARGLWQGVPDTRWAKQRRLCVLHSHALVTHAPLSPHQHGAWSSVHRSQPCPLPSHLHGLLQLCATARKHRRWPARILVHRLHCCSAWRWLGHSQRRRVCYASPQQRRHKCFSSSRRWYRQRLATATRCARACKHGC